MKRYPAVGGPLDGAMLTANDLRVERKASITIGSIKEGQVLTPGGMHGQHGNDYHPYNRQEVGSPWPTQIWLYRGLLG